MKIESFENLKSIFIGDKDLTEVEIGNCPKLEQIVLFNSSINRIIISNCDALRELEVSDGELTSLDFLKNLPTKNLTKINLMNNNISPQTLDIFIPFQNLCNLEIGCDEEGAKKGKRNNFFGSLAPLKNINNEFNNNLTLDISGTDIESGLEYISLERFNDNMYYLKCKPRRENDKVKAIFNQLDPYFKSDFHRELGEIEIDEELGLKKPKEKDEGEKIPKTPPPTDPPLAPPKIPPQKPSQEPPDNQNQNNPEPTQNLPNQPNISNNQNNNSDSKPSIFLTRSNTKKTITKLLMENNFKTTDLDDKFAN